jgi:hypothetical protein
VSFNEVFFFFILMEEVNQSWVEKENFSQFNLILYFFYQFRIVLGWDLKKKLLWMSLSSFYVKICLKKNNF